MLLRCNIDHPPDFRHLVRMKASNEPAGSGRGAHRVNRRRAVALALAAGVALSSLGGCGRPSSASTPMKAAPPEVNVVVVHPHPVPITTELPGRISSHLVAEVRPQVSGIIQKRLFVEGSDVKAGQALYQIDAASYRAAFDSAKAALAKAEANRVPARLKSERLRELLKKNAVSRQDVDDADAAFKLADAEVAAARATLETARINLDYTTLKAPISGRIGRSLVSTGALVTAGQAAPLATIQQLDPVYVDATQSTAELLRLKHELASGVLRNAHGGSTKVHLVLEDGSTYPEPGSLKFSDVTVNQSTGSVTLRTVFPNPDHELLPGMYVRAVLEEGVMDGAILVPQRGVTRSPTGDAVAMVVGKGDKVEQRKLSVLRAIGESWLVDSGLEDGDRLIVDGLQKIRPGSPVKIAEVDGTAAPAAQTVAEKP